MSMHAAISALRNNQIVALPTEGLYGLSGRVTPDVANDLSRLKNRPDDKGFIIVSANPDDFLPWIDTTQLTCQQYQTLISPCDKPTTWLVPAKPNLSWLTGPFSTIAIRLTSHPVLKTITHTLGEPIISTSANISNQPPATSPAMIQQLFGNQIACIIDHGPVKQASPSCIIDLQSGKIIRQ